MAQLLPRFERITFVYKTVNNVDVKADVLIPESLSVKKTPHPLLVHFHGGGLVMGRILETAFLAEWYILVVIPPPLPLSFSSADTPRPLKLIEERDAILVSPEYRLMPESNGTDILEDIGDFWVWVTKKLPAALLARKPNVHINLDQVAVTGESAGGYLSLQSALLFPEAKIRVVMTQYGAMHTDIEVFKRDPNQSMPPEVDVYRKKMAPGAIRTSTSFIEMLQLAVQIFQSGSKTEVMGDDERLTIGYGLRTAKTIPPLWVMQGTDDRIMPNEATDTMVARIREARPEVPLLYSVQPGDHGFDMKSQLDDPWMVEAMDFVKKYWP